VTSDGDLHDAAMEVAGFIEPDTDALRQAVNGVARGQAERMERELRGAWRAGYDHLHVYDEVDNKLLGRDTPDMALSLTRAVFPGYEGDPRPDPPGYAYRFSYDLTSVPDEEIRRAIRGERGDA